MSHSCTFLSLFNNKIFNMKTQTELDNWTLDCTPDMTVTINGRRGIYSGICDVTHRYIFSMFDGSMQRLYTLDNVFFD